MRLAPNASMHQHPMVRPTRRLAVLPLVAVLAALMGCGKSGDTVQPTLDTVAPTVSSTNPGNGAVGVAVISATFSEPMNASTITTASFTVVGLGASAVPGTVAYNASADVATFTPNNALSLNSGFTATITTGAKDAAGNPLATNHAWSFTTLGSPSAQGAVALGGAGAFAVLAGSTVTNTGGSSLTGDLGVSPGTAVTGFPPGLLTGAMHAGDVTSAAGIADLTTAYNDAAGRTLAPVTLAGNLGGLTLPPGLYKSTSSLAISSGDLTLDAQGDANAVFIFQMASTLTTTTGRAVILSGGAKAANVFWQVGSSATLGTSSVFKGTIMADQSISLNTGASLSGRALARIGAVTLAGNAVVIPTP